MAVYLDSSAIVKLVVKEAESHALTRHLRRHVVRVSSALAHVDVLRAVRAQGTEASARARQVLAHLVLVAVDNDILEAAASLDGAVLRSLDALHLATAASLASDLTALVAYDARMIAAARALGMRVASPT